MNIGILSGKGGTGKTTLSTNLAVMLEATYVDCDVEEPNGFIFLNPDIKNKRKVTVEHPFVDENKCNLCGECVKVCQFNALAKIKDDILLFNKLCHSCGSCEIVCKNEAITYEEREIGYIEEGSCGGINCKRGVLNVGEPMAVPIIKELLKDLKDDINVIDFPPGTSCNVVNSLRYVDRAILVTEPTVFGLHDLKMAVKLLRQSNVPFDVIINKYTEDRDLITTYCDDEGINIIGKIPYHMNAAKAYSKGKLLIELEEYNRLFKDIVRMIRGA